MAEENLPNTDGVVADGNPQAQLSRESFTPSGELKTTEAALALVVQSAQSARDFITNKQWNLLWRDADLLYQSPRPMTTYENTYVLEPNVQRFTVAKIINAVVPQLYKGLFYDDPPMALRPRPGTSQEVTDAKTALFSYILDQCNFKTQTKWGLEVMTHQGTGIWKWGYDWKPIKVVSRQASSLVIKSGSSLAEQVDNIPLDIPPDVKYHEREICLPFFEHRPLDRVLVDPKLEVSDIREASWVVDVYYMDFYQLRDLQDALKKSGDTTGWNFLSEEEMRNIWIPRPDASVNTQVENVVYMKTAVHHSQELNVGNNPDPLRVKLEMLEYWDKDRKIIVLENKKVLFEGENEFGCIPFLSANWWNRPRAFYGMGLGLTVGQNQRVDQGTINAILKILSYGVNPIYIASREANPQTQMIRTNIGKVLKVDGDTEKAYRLMETPKVPGEIWAALQESEKATESTSGADQMLVQGTTSGPRSSMGRTAGGAAIQASASATRLDGPLDNFIEQVFKPFLYIIDMLITRKMSDGAIVTILGQEVGDTLVQSLNMNEFHSTLFEYEVLAGASLSAKRTMAQSMVMLTQIFENPQIMDQLAEINEEYIDWKPILSMWLEASEWKNKQDIIKPMTAAMKAKRQQNSPAAQMQAKVQAAQAQTNQKFQQKQQLQEQSENARVERDLVVAAAKATGFDETVEGEPGVGGLQGQLPNV